MVPVITKLKSGKEHKTNQQATTKQCDRCCCDRESRVTGRVTHDEPGDRQGTVVGEKASQGSDLLVTVKDVLGWDWGLLGERTLGGSKTTRGSSEDQSRGG